MENHNFPFFIFIFCISFDGIFIVILFLGSCIINDIHQWYIERLISLLCILMSPLFPWTPLFTIIATCYCFTSQR